MAENLFGSTSNTSAIPVEHLDYTYIKNCTDTKELAKILRVLNSGDEGYYPDLIRFCEQRIEEVAGPESKYLRKDKPPSTAGDMEKEEWQELSSNFQTWTNEMNLKDDLLKKNVQSGSQEDNLPPIRSGGTINTDTGQATLADQKPFYQPSPDRIKSAEYRKWDKFDVEKEVEKLDKEEEPYSKPQNADKNATFDIEHTIDSTGMTDAERELKANREKDKGNEAFHAKEFAEAVAYYSRSISLIGSAAAYNNRALARIRIEKFQEALDDCNVVLQMEADNVKGYMRRGVSKKGLKDLAGAKKDFQHVLSLEPNNKRAKDLLAEIAAEEEKVKKNSRNASVNKSGRRIVIEEVEGSDSSEEEEEEGEGQGREDVNHVAKEEEDTVGNENVHRTSERDSDQNGEVLEEVISWTEEDDRKLFGDSVGKSGSGNEKKTSPDVNGEDSDVVMQDVSDEPKISDVTIEKVDFGKTECSDPNSQSDLKSQDEMDGARKSKMSNVEQKPEVPPRSQPPAEPTQSQAVATKPPMSVVEAKPPSPSPPPPLPDAVVHLKNQGNELYKAGQYGEAVEKYSKAIDKLKSDRTKHAANLSVLYSNRAACHSKTGDCRSCITDCNTALDLVPFSPKPLLRRANAYETLEKYRDAYVDYQSVFVMDPSSAPAQTGSSRMSNILKEQDGPEWRDRLPKTAMGPPLATAVPAAPPIVTTTAQPKATSETTTTKTEESAPRMSATATGIPPKETIKKHENLSKAERFKLLKDEGNEKVKRGLFAEAVQKYTACIGVDDMQVVSFTNRALCFLRLDEPMKAESDCNTALEMEPENIKALFRRAQARKMLSQYKASLQDLNTLLRVDPKNTAAKKELELVKEYWLKELREAQEKQKKEAEKQTKKESKQNTNKKQTQKARNRVTIEEVESSSEDEEDEPEPKARAKKTSKAKSKGKDSASKKPDAKSPTPKADKKPKESSPRAAEPGKTKQTTKGEKSEAKSKSETKSGDGHKQDSGGKKQASKITEVSSKQAEQQNAGAKSSKSKKKGKQKAAVETPVVQSTAEPVLNKATPYEFMQAWTSLKRKETVLYAKLLRQVQPEDLPRVLSNKLEGDMLTMIVKSVSEHFVDKGEEDLGYQYLTNLRKADRFQVVAMFLSDKDKRTVKSVISKLTAHTSSVYSDKNLEDLMSSYGVAS